MAGDRSTNTNDIVPHVGPSSPAKDAGPFGLLTHRPGDRAKYHEL